MQYIWADICTRIWTVLTPFIKGQTCRSSQLDVKRSSFQRFAALDVDNVQVEWHFLD